MFNNPLTNSLWVEKYRPQNLQEYIGNEELKNTIQKYIDNDDTPSLLLAGKQGTGKTAIAQIITKHLDCDVLSLNASDENNVDTMRNKIKSFVSSIGFRKWKIVFLDEADYLTTASQAILRNMMETYSTTSRFILTCNYPEKIIPAIQSRCEIFHIYPPSKKEVAKRVVDILNQENIEYELKDVGAVITKDYPDLRKIISSLQRQVSDNKLILHKETILEAGYLEKIVNALSENVNAKRKYTTIRQIIADSKVRTFEDLYTYLYENVDTFAKERKVAQSIIEIAEGMRNDPMCVDKELNVMAMLIRIIEVNN